ncbi:hypothetical protein LC55x_4781 [Lysobacter capsici]|nr:hypothetical protein LC55x_4781 [Lysobacter capsici]
MAASAPREPAAAIKPGDKANCYDRGSFNGAMCHDPGTSGRRPSRF